MLILGFNVGKERYGIEAIKVIEIVPLIELKKVPLSDALIKGLFNYRGTPTPVLDLCQLFEQRNCDNSLSSRIILIEHILDSQLSSTIGLVAEKVTDVIKCNKNELESNGIRPAKNDFLGHIYKHNNELIQIVEPSKLLPDSIKQQLNKSYS